LEKVLEEKMGWASGRAGFGVSDLTRLRSIAFGSFYTNERQTFTSNVARHVDIWDAGAVEEEEEGRRR
jgi:hypothetical protein